MSLGGYQVETNIIDTKLDLCLNALTEARSPSEKKLRKPRIFGWSPFELRTGCSVSIGSMATGLLKVSPQRLTLVPRIKH